MNDLTNEYQRLVRLEEVVDKGVRNMLDAADALKEIRDNKLYSERGYETFDLYLADEWGFGRNYINKIIRASEKRKLLGTTVPDSIVDQLGECLPRRYQQPFGSRCPSPWQTRCLLKKYFVKSTL